MAAALSSLNFFMELTGDLKQFFDNLKKDGVDIKTEFKGGDSKIIITTRNWKTVLGANDLGVWGEKQESIKRK